MVKIISKVTVLICAEPGEEDTRCAQGRDSRSSTDTQYFCDTLNFVHICTVPGPGNRTKTSNTGLVSWQFFLFARRDAADNPTLRRPRPPGDPNHVNTPMSVKAHSAICDSGTFSSALILLYIRDRQVEKLPGAYGHLTFPRLHYPHLHLHRSREAHCHFYYCRNILATYFARCFYTLAFLSSVAHLPTSQSFFDHTHHLKLSTVQDIPSHVHQEA